MTTDVGCCSRGRVEAFSRCSYEVEVIERVMERKQRGGRKSKARLIGAVGPPTAFRSQPGGVQDAFHEGLKEKKRQVMRTVCPFRWLSSKVQWMDRFVNVAQGTQTMPLPFCNPKDSQGWPMYTILDVQGSNKARLKPLRAVETRNTDQRRIQAGTDSGLVHDVE